MKEIALKVAAGLSATAVALGAAGCGVVKPKYNQQTEQKIERIITPTMKNIARAAIKLQRDSNGRVSASYLGHGLTEVSGLTTHEAGLNDNNGVSEIDAVMRDYPGTQTPNPNSVVLAAVENADNLTGKSISVAGGVEFIAPNLGDLPSKVSASDVSSDEVIDTKGWTAIDTGSIANAGSVDAGGSYNTADASEFTQDDYYNPTNPVATARFIVSEIPDTLAVVINDFTD